MSSILELDSISVNFGGLQALDDVTFSLREASISALIGPNGAGKTTCFNVVSGLCAPNHGRVRFKGSDVTRVPAHKRKGMGRTFQIVDLFTGMTVRENVMLGLHRHLPGGFLSAGFRLSAVRRSEEGARTDANRILDELDLLDCADSAVGALPLGRQRLVEVARALATSPDLVLLDEAASGLARDEINELVNCIVRVRDAGCSVFLVEHNVEFVRRLAQHLIVLDFGRVIYEGDVAGGMGDAAVVTAYLGKGAAHARRT